MKIFLSTILLLNGCLLFSQKVTVIDSETQDPVELCTIYSEGNSKVLHTDKQGVVDLTIYEDSDVIIFKHMSYIEF